MTPTPLRRALTAAATLTVAASLTGCALTHPRGWEGPQNLSGEQVTLPVFQAQPGLPKQTPTQVAARLGHNPKSGTLDKTGTTLTGKDWGVVLQSGISGTTLRYQRTCGTPGSAAAAGSTTRTFLHDLGLNPDDYTQFTGKADQHTRVWVQPLITVAASATPAATVKILGEEPTGKTWSTGVLSMITDKQGVCAAAGTLTGFTVTGDTMKIVSAKDAFKELTSTTNPNIPADLKTADYVDAQPVWTLGDSSRVIAGWSFTTKNGEGLIVIDLGDGLEVTPDTRTFVLHGKKPAK